MVRVRGAGVRRASSGGVLHKVCHVAFRRALHHLTPYLRQPTACLDDGAYETGADDRPAQHVLDVVRVDRPDTSGVVAIGEAAVLHPAHAYQIGGFVEQAGDVIKLGEPRTGLVAELELACLSSPSPPAQVGLGWVGCLEPWAPRW